MRAKSPTRKQKEIISSKGLNPDNWLIAAESVAKLHIKHKASGKIRSIEKE